MARLDSLDKVIGVYFSLVADEAFEYRGKRYYPRKLQVSPLLFRGFTCPPGCGGCCPRFSLDYLPSEMRPADLELTPRAVEFNGYQICVLSDMQTDHKDYHCRNLDKSNGRCNVHGRQPFSCDFELIRFLEFQDEARPNVLTQKLFGRGWQLLRVDGERGALCEMTPVDDHTIAEVVRKLKRLKEWCEHFRLSHRVDPIIEWATRAPHDKPLVV